MKKRLWPFHKIWPYFWPFFSVCHCGIKFSLYVVFLYFLDGIHVTHCYSNTVTLQYFIALVCSDDLAHAVSRFCADVFSQ